MRRCPIFPLALLFRHRLVRWGSSALSGILLFACFPQFDWTFLVWIACVPLILAALYEPSLLRAYVLGAVSGIIFLVGSVYWFTIAMRHYGNLSAPVAWAVMLLFAAVMSSFWGAFALAESWVARRSLRLALLLAPFLWTALELGRTYYYFSGFPWNLLGYAVAPLGLRQIAAATAVYGLGFIAVATSALVAWMVIEQRFEPKRLAGIAFALWIVALVIANHALRPGPLPPPRNLAVLVQPNVPLNEAADDWAPWRNRAPLDKLIHMSLHAAKASGGASGPAPLIVWPEDSAPFFFNRDPVFRDAIEDMAREARGYAVVGATNFAGIDQTSPQNAAIVIDPLAVPVLQYAKIHLVPFGEYVPGWLSGLAGKITSEAGDFVPGRSYAQAATSEGWVSVFICYEAIFPQLVRRLAQDAPAVLVNISDDAWYGDSSAAAQHLSMASMRAIENHRYLLRATNDGITAVVDPNGRILARLPRHQEATLASRFSFSGARTFYNAHGDVFAWSCVVVTGALLGVRGLRKAA